MATAYGQRPSSFLDELDDTEALAVDLESFRVGMEDAERRRAHAESAARLGRR
jgi:hypothetical protein